MLHPRPGRLSLAVAIAATISAASLLVPRRGEASWWPNIKQLMCATVACPVDGERKCADVTGEIKNPTGTGSLSVTWYCYEPGRPRPGDDTDSIF